MKKLAVIPFLIFSLMLISGQTVTNSDPRLEIYYFHAAKRCPTCISIEENVKSVLDLFFKKETDSGIIKFIILDGEEKENKALVERFEAYGSTLILLSDPAGKQIKEDMTNFAFSYSRNKPEKFKEGVKEKIEELIKQ